MRKLEGRLGVLFHQHHGHTGGVDCPDGIEDRPHQERCQAETGFVEQQQPGVAHQGTSDSQHLLLTAAEGASQLVTSFGQAGKEVVNPLTGPRDFCLVVDGEGAEVDVLLNGQGAEHAPALGRLADPGLHHTMGLHLVQSLAFKEDLALGRSHQSTDTEQRGRFPGPVCPKNGDDLALVHGQVDPVKHLDIAIPHMQIVNYQQHQSSSSLSAPR